MSELSLNEGQEFYAGGKRFAIRGGVPVEVLIKKGALGGDLQRLGDIKWVEGQEVYIKGSICVAQPKNNEVSVFVDDENRFDLPSNLTVEINVPQPQAKGRVMTAGEAARLPDIVGKEILIRGSVVKTEWGSRPLVVSPKSTASPQIEWRVSDRIIVEVLD